ncbi:hypothetical protein B0H11DRAFT_2278101 [Mycena galericulata]|nr:hypothetical protein B0H11DRAFT_2278101 [Mycena galericulata]
MRIAGLKGAAECALGEFLETRMGKGGVEVDILEKRFNVDNGGPLFDPSFAEAPATSQAVPARRALGLAAPREGGWITITTRHQTRTGWAMWAAHGPASGTARQRRDERCSGIECSTTLHARVSGKPGVVWVSRRIYIPGKSLPLPSARKASASDTFQEADIVGISRRYEAFKIATSGRPGPVPMDLSKDVTVNILRAALPFKQATPATPRSTSRTASYHLRVLSPPPPLVPCSSHSSPSAATFPSAQHCRVSVHSTRRTRRACTHGSAYVNLAIQKAEVIIALGSRFNDRVTMKVDQFASGARAAAAQGRGGIIHFEILPKNVNKVASMPMPSPAYTSASSHIARLAPRTLLRDPSEYLPLARARVRPVCPPLAPRPLSPPHPPSRYRPHVSPPRRPRARRRLLALFVTAPAPCVACVSPMPAVAFTPCVPASHPPPSPPCPPPSPRALLLAPSPPPSTPCPPCTRRLIPMSRPPHPPPVPPPMSHPVPAVTTGLATAFQFRIAVKVLVLNNEFQGMMQQWQDGLVLLGALSHSHTRRMTNPDFVLLAQAMGVHALRCETAADLPVQMAEFLAYDNNK